MSDALVSVVMGVFNGAAFLREALASILGQSHASLEVIVVDDGSSDGSGEIAAAHARVRVLRQENAGLPTALNAGLAEAKGAYIAFLDADDLWPRGHLRQLVAHLEDHPELGYACGRLSEFRDGTTPREPGPEELARLGDRAALSLGCMVVRAEVFRQVGPFDTQFSHSHDVDWSNRAKEAGVRMEVLPVLALHRRLHAANLSREAPDARRRDFLRAVKVAMDRRRR